MTVALPVMRPRTSPWTSTPVKCASLSVSVVEGGEGVRPLGAGEGGEGRQGRGRVAHPGDDERSAVELRRLRALRERQIGRSGRRGGDPDAEAEGVRLGDEGQRDGALRADPRDARQRAEDRRSCGDPRDGARGPQTVQPGGEGTGRQAGARGAPVERRADRGRRRPGEQDLVARGVRAAVGTRVQPRAAVIAGTTQAPDAGLGIEDLARDAGVGGDEGELRSGGAPAARQRDDDGIAEQGLERGAVRQADELSQQVVEPGKGEEVAGQPVGQRGEPRSRPGAGIRRDDRGDGRARVGVGERLGGGVGDAAGVVLPPPREDHRERHRDRRHEQRDDGDPGAARHPRHASAGRRRDGRAATLQPPRRDSSVGRAHD